MAKKTIFICQDCGYESTGWLGKCPSCLNWNTFAEEKIQPVSKVKVKTGVIAKPVNLSDISAETEKRITTGISELDRVLGGGIVHGSLILVGGDPGIGKSTLLLQLCESIGDVQTLYISGEESIRQIKMRADRLGVRNRSVRMVCQTDFEAVYDLICSEKPGLVIIDSIQTMHSSDISSAPGSVGQVREVTAGFMRISKDMGIPVILVGHVTKEGAFAGPRVMEHMVDTALYFEGEKQISYRVLRAVKNRFGSTNEIGIFEMRDSGLVEVTNPSMMLLSGKPEGVPGSVVVSGLEGTRPMLLEVQALVCPTAFGMPRRMATGVDYNRITMLMAVLEKRVGLPINNFDAYVNVAGGLKIAETSCDLGIVTAIASSFRDKPVKEGYIVIGEVGLTGEVRAVSQIEKRLSEAARIGFKSCVIPKANVRAARQSDLLKDFEIVGVETVQQALRSVLS